VKPCSYKSRKAITHLQSISMGLVIAKIQGSIAKIGKQYKDATTVLYNKANLQPIAVTRPDQNGNYQFLGLNTDLKTYIVAFDRKQQYNAITQDSVVPK